MSKDSGLTTRGTTTTQSSNEIISQNRQTTKQKKNSGVKDNAPICLPLKQLSYFFFLSIKTQKKRRIKLSYRL
jgi:hypothetical protein